MAQTVLELGYGGQTLAARELGWNRTTIRKGIKELERGIRDLRASPLAVVALEGSPPT
jgi:hypothetical protein